MLRKDYTLGNEEAMDHFVPVCLQRQRHRIDLKIIHQDLQPHLLNQGLSNNNASCLEHFQELHSRI